MAGTATHPMDGLLEKMGEVALPESGQLVEGKVVTKRKNLIIVDIDGIATGIIRGRELKDSQDTVEELQIGDPVSAYVIEGENEEGYIVMSLRKANQERTWNKFLDAYENGTVIEVKANEANKGGLLLDADGIKGFIPVSQLAPMHYPRVNDADANQILARLQKLVSMAFKVKIINLDKDTGKLILSEKAAMEEERLGALKKLKVGDVVTGTISGIVKFGIFVAFEGLEGLVHISEIAWGHVKNPGDYGKLGEKVDVEVIGIDGEKISLSMKRLVPDPWLEAAKKYKIGSTVEGEVNRITPFGAFVRLSEEINGLIHVTELGDNVRDAGEIMKVGDIVKAKVIAVEPEEHRVGLSIKALTEKKKSVVKKDEEEVAEEGADAKEEADEAPAEEAKKKPAKKKAAAKKDAKEGEEKETEEEKSEEAAAEAA